MTRQPIFLIWTIFMHRCNHTTLKWKSVPRLFSRVMRTTLLDRQMESILFGTEDRWGTKRLRSGVELPESSYLIPWMLSILCIFAWNVGIYCFSQHYLLAKYIMMAANTEIGVILNYKYLVNNQIWESMLSCSSNTSCEMFWWPFWF